MYQFHHNKLLKLCGIVTIVLNLNPKRQTHVLYCADIPLFELLSFSTAGIENDL